MSSSYLESWAKWGHPGDSDSQWRYVLGRRWGGSGRTVAFIGLNPSTADECQLDPTCRRCVGFAKAWGFDRYLMLNIFALRSTDPRALYSHPDPVGPENDHAILAAAREADLVICAWGSHGKFGGRGRAVAKMLEAAGATLHRLAVTKDGQPAHPLYLRSDLTPASFSADDLAERSPRKSRRRSADA